MSNLIVDGFAHYGRGLDSTSVGATRLAMLSGAWAEVPSVGFNGITKLPWDLSNDDLYASTRFAGGTMLRRVLPSPLSTIIASFYVALSNLPTQNFSKNLIEFRDNANAQIAVLGVQSTGSLYVGTNQTLNTVELASSNGPVIVAETATHIEIKFTPGTGADGTVTVNANGATVINATGLVLSNHNNVAQFCLGSDRVNPGATFYFANLIVRDTSGDFNNDIVGDRRVATLIVNADDPEHQGWTARPLRRFGNGILNNGTAPSPGGTASHNAGVFCGVTTDTDMGNLDFTIEGQFRFQRLPTGSNKAVFFGKWDEAANQRSYQLYLGGPSLNSGNLVWRISTDGTNGTVQTLFSYPWKPVVGQWYHVAVCRQSGVTNVYIDGVPLGTGFADANIYFAGSSRTALMVETSGGGGVANTALDGWNDEFRITKAFARYTGTFTPPSAAFPRGPTNDPQWSSVVWLSGWDQASVADDSGFARPLSAINGAAALTPDDGGAAYQTINKNIAKDDNFIEASLLFASGILTQTALPTNNKTVTVGTKDGTNPAVYTWKTTLTGGGSTPFEVLIGADVFSSLTNLMNAILAGPGEGTTYGTGTTANFDVTAEQLPINQLFVQALTAGTVGNSIAVATDDPNGSWGVSVTTLLGGADIPPFSQFTTQHLPPGASVVDSLTIVRRSWKTDAGTCTVRASFVGPDGGVENGAVVPESTTPTLHHDTFETDPDNPGGALTPTAILLGKLRINRTA
jgi:hypothetical protein